MFLGFDDEPILGCLHGNTAPEQYLTIEELAERLKLSPKTIRNKMTTGVLMKGTHYFSPRGLGPRFKWSAVEKWIEESTDTEEQSSEDIPMARGYVLGRAQSDGTKFAHKRAQREN
jgi:hypothetical protein